MKAIHAMLSHHYVVRKSIVFIVDTAYSNVVYQEKANQYAESFFRDLDSQDYFGYISLGNKDAALD